MIFSKARQAGVETSKKLFLNSELFQPALENPEVATRLAEMVLSYSGWSLLNPSDSKVSLEIPAAKQLDKIDIPTLIIVGERDLPDLHDIADALEHGIPKATKLVIPGVGHMANMEAPEKFNEFVLSFLSEINACS
jgi:pimeloyl-ACP methyl ester carboxylesterase